MVVGHGFVYLEEKIILKEGWMLVMALLFGRKSDLERGMVVGQGLVYLEEKVILKEPWLLVMALCTLK